jgi:MFS family permease
MNVTAGIGILGQASAMIQEAFKGKIDPGAAAGFVGLLSLFNMAGRVFWSSLSDRIGRKTTYLIFFTLGMALYALIPSTETSGRIGLFVACFAVILTMYGGGFATIPAYLADLFGTRYVGAIHGRLLTAWSVAGVLGPVLVNYIREYEISVGVPKAEAYNVTLYLMAGLLAIGLVANLMVRPVDPKHYIREADPPIPSPTGAAAVGVPALATPRRRPLAIVPAWAMVGLPLAWGIASTVAKAAKLFK